MKVSVIIPVYNVEHYLRECLDSVLNQSLKEIEVIVINDGSTDRSLGIIMEYQSRFEHFIYINQVNKGLSASRNVGLRLATGEYIYFLDSDDYLTTDALETCYQEAKQDDLDILMFTSTIFYEQGDQIDHCYRQPLPESVVSGTEFFKQFYADRSYNAATCYQFYRRSFLLEQDLFFYEGIIHEDELYTFQSLLVAKAVKYLPKSLYFRRVHPGSITTTLNKQKKVESFVTIAQESKKTSEHRSLLWDDDMKISIQKVIDQFYYLSLYYCDLYQFHRIRDEIVTEIHLNHRENIELQMQADASCLFYHRHLYLKNLRDKQEGECEHN